MTDRATFDAWFKRFNSWDLSQDDLLKLAFTPGSDPGDVVFTPPTGKSSMTRYQCSRWLDFYGSAWAGWEAACQMRKVGLASRSTAKHSQRVTHHKLKGDI